MKKKYALRHQFSVPQGRSVVVGPAIVELSDDEAKANVHKLEDVHPDELAGYKVGPYGEDGPDYVDEEPVKDPAPPADPEKESESDEASESELGDEEENEDEE